MAARVRAARELQRRRFADPSPAPVNAAMGSEALRRHAYLRDGPRQLLDAAVIRASVASVMAMGEAVYRELVRKAA